MSKIIYSKNEAEKIAVSFSPKKFPFVVQKPALEFVASRNAMSEDDQASGFRIDRIVSEQTGIADIERLSLEEKVEREALARLKDVQEQAYSQAYQLGLNEGRERAFRENEGNLKAGLLALDNTVNAIISLKSELVAANEAHIVQTIYRLVEKVVYAQVKENPQLILKVMQQSIEGAQGDENITIRISQSDHTFIESIRAKLGKEYEFVTKARFEVLENISPGGCTVVTNYGQIDSTIEQRIEKLWQVISERLPEVKDELTSEPLPEDAPGSGPNLPQDSPNDPSKRDPK